MISSLRRLSAAVGGIALAGGLLVVGAVSTPDALPQSRPVFVSSCIGYCTHPTNAAKVFRWGLEAWRQEFETGSLGANWQSDHPDAIGQQQGMLTIRAASDSGTVKVWPDDQAATVGRWEARVRAFEKDRTGQQYRFTWQLVPVGGDDACGANTIVLGSYVPGDTSVTGAVRTMPDRSFGYSRTRDLRSRAWHTYAVEVTKDHVSWFVDTKVMRTERRPEALSGVKYRPQFVMEGAADTRMRASWMQMDWVRYYTLNRPNAKSINAPQMERTTYDAPGC
jgi:hypothetical protein